MKTEASLGAIQKLTEIIVALKFYLLKVHSLLNAKFCNGDANVIQVLLIF